MKYLSFFRVALLAALFASPVHADQAPGLVSPEPQLRIEAGMHTALIRQISSDASGRLALSGGYDKTGRVWDVASGRLVQVLRPPIAEGDEGKIYACALSPDGREAVLAGWTSFEWTGENSIYVFDVSSGRMVRRIGGLPTVILNMVYSPDGRYLAATLAGAGGVWVFDLKNKDLAAKDTAYEIDSYGMAWSSDGRLAVACDDGRIRLYRVAPGKLERTAVIAAKGGTQPYSVAFNPDGSRLAVGYFDTMAVEIYDGKTLAFRQSLKVPEDFETGSLGSVAWIAGGKALAAGGKYMMQVDGEWRNPVCIWSGAGLAKREDVPAAESTIMYIQGLPNGQGLVASADPAWGVVESPGTWIPRQTLPIADLRCQQEVLLLAEQARRVQFGYRSWGTDPWTFTLDSRQLQQGSLMGAAAADVTGLPLANWLDSHEPKLGDITLELMDNELCRCAAVAPDRKSFFLGTSYRLSAYDAEGAMLWTRPVPGETWAINLSADGKLVVAAYSDGTIRWHKAADGSEILAFFPHGDQKRWVLWTPGGYYDCSPGGEELMGWHLNQGLDRQADFYPAGRFRDRFYRPDVIDLILRTLDEDDALTKADKKRGVKTAAASSIDQTLPPVVDLLSPGELNTSQNTITLRYQLRSPADAPVLAVRVRVDGQALDAKGLKPAADKDQGQSMSITIPAADCEIQLFAENRNGTSTPAVVRVTWTGKKAAGFEIKPKLYILAVGVGAYENADIPRLNLAAKDARDFAEAMKKQEGKLYRAVEVRTLTDNDATKDEILDGLDWLRQQVTQHDVGMLFLSGHGLDDPGMGYVYLPVNANPDKLLRTAVSMNDIKSTLASLTGKAVFFLDTCHSGNVLGPARKGIGTDINGVINELSSAENGVVVFSSSTGRQYSLESPEWGNGAFTKALIEGLSGKADYQGTGRITYKMLDLWLSERVKQLTRGAQSPVTQAPGGIPDFPLASQN